MKLILILIPFFLVMLNGRFSITEHSTSVNSSVNGAIGCGVGGLNVAGNDFNQPSKIEHPLAAKRQKGWSGFQEATSRWER